MPVSSIGLATYYGAAAPIALEAMRQKPIPESAQYAINPLISALDQRVESSGRTAPNVSLRIAVPEDTRKGRYDAFANTSNYASSGRTAQGNDYVKYNPNSSRELFAHELGHIAARNTDLGAFLNNTRHSPVLRNAIGKAALMTIPAGVLAAAVPGDEDVDESVALAALIAAPEILDEVNATRHGLGIMKDAGMRADVGQRARLAGGLLSYMAIPLAAGGAANLIGNIVDEDQQTTATMPIN